MFSFAVFQYVAILQFFSVVFLGEAAVPSAGLHPHFTRMTVITARIAFGYFAILAIAAFIQTL